MPSQDVGDQRSPLIPAPHPLYIPIPESYPRIPRAHRIARHDRSRRGASVSRSFAGNRQEGEWYREGIRSPD
ncbi:hypothetical protein L209DRAFT_309799 [Thermothelomyces heterothallicus CBS 203.75]